MIENEIRAVDNVGEFIARMTCGKNVQNWTNSPKVDIRKAYNPNIALDSFCLYIPETSCNFIHNDITRGIITLVTDEDGEVLEEEYKFTKTGKNSVKVERKGYTIYFQYVKRSILNPMVKKPTIKSYIRININSKFLEADYLTGINEKTIDIILNRINETGLITIKREKFMKCIASDIDFKQDRLIEGSKEDVKRFFDAAYKSVKVEFENAKSKTLTASNMIIDTSKRTNVRMPYHKYYSKLTELVYNSQEFNEAHLGLCDNGNEQIIRCELTISGQKVAEKLKLITSKERLSLEKLMFLVENQSELNSIFADIQNERYNDIEMNTQSENQTPSLKVCKLSQKDADVIYSLVFESIFVEECSDSFAYRIAQKIGKGSDRKEAEAKDIATRAIADAKNAIVTKENSISQVVKEATLFSIFRQTV